MPYPAAVETAADLPYLSPFGEQVPPGVQPGDLLQELRDRILTLQAAVGADGSARRMHTRRSMVFNIDNGAGATRDDVMSFESAVTIRAARVIYVGDATAGTVAAATTSLGTTLGGVDIVAATALVNGSVLGTVSPLTVLTASDVNKLAADAELFIRHTGIATTAAGEYVVEVDYTID